MTLHLLFVLSCLNVLSFAYVNKQTLENVYGKEFLKKPAFVTHSREDSPALASFEGGQNEKIAGLAGQSQTLRTAEYASQFLGKLSAFQTREWHSKYAFQASEFIKQDLQKLGLQVKTQSLSREPWGIVAPNVIGIMPGTLEKTVVIVSGHYDSRASDMNNETVRSPGSDDNGSGATMTRMVAQLLSKGDISGEPFKFKHSIHFLFPNAEEPGLIGADAYAKYLQVHDYTVVGVFNADMVGYSNPANPAPQIALIRNNHTWTNASSTWLNDVVVNITDMYFGKDGLNLNFPTGYSEGCCEDSQMFMSRGFPSVSFFSRIGQVYSDSPYYHTPQDAMDTISLEQILAVVGSCLVSVATMAMMM